MTETFDEFFDQRRHRRVAVRGEARINYGGRWHSCNIIDLSGGGGRFSSEIKPIQGANVLVQLRGIGMVRGIVLHRDHEGFAVEFNRADYDRDTMVDNLMLSANSQLLDRSRGLPEAEGADPANTEEGSKEAGAEKFDDQDPEYRRLLKENKGRHPLRIRKLMNS